MQGDNDMVNKLKRGAVYLDIDHIDVRNTGEEEAELIAHCTKLLNILRTKGELHQTVQEMQLPPIFLESA